MSVKTRASLSALSRLQPAEWLMLLSFGVFGFVYPFAMLLLSLDLMPFGMEWMSSLLLAALGLCAWGWLWSNFGTVGLVTGLGILLSGLILEYIGVTTGLPFGRYRYTGVLVPEIAGGVPLAMGFAWLLVSIGGLFTATRLLKASTPLLVALLGALLAVGLDLLLEPVAYHVKGYWTWSGGDSGYYGVPWTNFIAWFLVSLVMNLAIVRVLHRRTPLRWRWLPPVLYIMNVVLFGVVNLAHGFWAAGPVALATLALALIGPTIKDRGLPLFEL